MRPLVNLSSKPFRNRRLFWMAVVALFAIPSYFGIEAIGIKARMEQERLGYQTRIGELEKKLKKVEKPATASVAISQDQNLQLLAANELIARRAFSWTQLLNDIERNLPPTVRILKITVDQLAAEVRDGTISQNKSGAFLAMSVVGKSEGEVTKMINRFLDSGRFKVFPLSKKPVEGLDEVEFELRVEYYPATSAPRSTGAANQVALAEKKEQ